jgi:hypothetical protein
MRYRHVFLLVVAILLAAAVQRARPVMGDEWLPISPEELKMTGDPKALGAPAITLYRQVDTDFNDLPREYNYVRIKIFTEEGRKYANVNIHMIKDLLSVRNIKARTIRPDGSIVNFDGKIYEKEITKARGFKYLAKTFTLSDVQLGSIVEYHYMKEGYLLNPEWVLSDDLFTRQAKFTFKGSGRWGSKSPNGLPPGAKRSEWEHDSLHMEAQDIPAFQVEDDMPPEGSMKYFVQFVQFMGFVHYIYGSGGIEKDADKFWKEVGKQMNGGAEGFVNKRKAMGQAVAQVVSPGDSPEVKLQRLYARAQSIRNTGYEIEKTEEEQKRSKEKEMDNVEDVWKRGYGTGYQINWLFLGLARAAGFDASPVRISRRDDHFFDKNLMNTRDLSGNVVVVNLDGKEMFFDPGAAFTPFGLLPWQETGTAGLKLDKDGGTWVTTPNPDSSASRIVRTAEMKLTSDGSLEGRLIVTFAGLEALSRRVEERNEDEAHRKKLLEDYVKEIVPVGIEVELTNKPDWTSSAPTLVAEYFLKVPGWVSGVGKRALLPVGLFGGPEKHMYEHSTRVHPLYFHYMYEKSDDVRIELPMGWQVSSLPQAVNNDAKLIVYTMKVENEKGTLHLERHLRSGITYLEQKYYGALRSFYQTVRTGDEEQIVLLPMGTAASN